MSGRDLQSEAEAILKELNRSRARVSMPLAFECVDYLVRAGGLRSSPERVKRRLVAVSYKRARAKESRRSQRRAGEPAEPGGGDP